MEKEFYLKKYEREAGLLLAVCDKEIYDKHLKEGDVDVHINPRFYGDKLATRDDVISNLRSCFSANFFGKKIVKLAVDLGLIEEENVRTVEGVPHAQFIRMEI